MHEELASTIQWIRLRSFLGLVNCSITNEVKQLVKYVMRSTI
jgi:hypothetical protein